MHKTMLSLAPPLNKHTLTHTQQTVAHTHSPPHTHTHVQDTIVFGADNLDSAAARQAELAAGTTPLGIGGGSKVVHAIIDSNARIGRGVSLTNKAGVKDGANSSLPKGLVIKDGILVVMRGAVVPDGTVV